MIMKEMGVAVIQNVVRMDLSKLAFTISAVNNPSVRIMPCHQYSNIEKYYYLLVELMPGPIDINISVCTNQNQQKKSCGSLIT